MSKAINFPNLGIHLENVGKSFQIFGLEIAYYGVIIAIALLAGMFMALWAAKKTGQDPDTYFDMGIAGILVSLVCARLYYVIFAWDQYKDHLLSIFNTREGGLAIYGGIIGAVLCMIFFAVKKKIPFGLLGDTVSVGLVLGQIIGRWGNFFNREAFGGYTDGFLAMQLPLNAVMRSDVTEEMMEHLVTIDGTEFIQVHPTFLYESLWNVGVLILLLYLLRHRRFHGQVFLWYLLGYGLGRLWIEGLRTDQLLMPVTGWPVSQVLSGVIVAVALLLLIRNRKNNELLKGRGRNNEKSGETERKN
jgi:phosphatidylglycerol:prolipoprotein diacylglycerol transferase